MKLAIIGGAGVRTPLFVAGALQRANRIGLGEICLMDIDEDKLALVGAICQEYIHRAGDPIRLRLTTDAREALQNTRYAVTTIRVGFEQGRVLDEEIALKQGVLGQETTGAGGFAMALRSIPAILEYGRLMAEQNPDGWLFNFTNPSGLVTQALRDAGLNHTVGICDSANTCQRVIAQQLGVKSNDLRPETFGLNHLSWTRRVLYQGEDQLSRLLYDPQFIAESPMKIFNRELIEQMGMWINEYLFYYYYAERAVESILQDEITRGEEVLKLATQLLNKLKAINIHANPDKALAIYQGYLHRRDATYMHYANPNAPSIQELDKIDFAASQAQEPNHASEGYAGVVLDVIESFESGQPLYTGLNVPNQDAINGMAPDDVVEISCRVDREGIHPLPIGSIPPAQLQLMKTIKLYERLTIEAIQKHSRAIAISALMVHPLVLSYSHAVGLVNDYLAAHKKYIGEWK